VDQDRHALDFRRLFVQHRHEIYACVFTLVPHIHDADDLSREGTTAIWQKFGQIGLSHAAHVQRRAGRSIDATRRMIQGGLAARADIFLLPLPSSSQPADPSERGNVADRAGTGDRADTSAHERAADFGSPRVIAYSRLGLGRTDRTPSDSIVALSQ
jgi:hypothetical protein